MKFRGTGNTWFIGLVVDTDNQPQDATVKIGTSIVQTDVKIAPILNASDAHENFRINIKHYKKIDHQTELFLITTIVNRDQLAMKKSSEKISSITWGDFSFYINRLKSAQNNQNKIEWEIFLRLFCSYFVCRSHQEPASRCPYRIWQETAKNILFCWNKKALHPEDFFL